MKVFKSLMLILLFTFSIQTPSLAFPTAKSICADKCDGIIKDGNCVPITNVNEISMKDLCIAKVKEGAKNSGFAILIMLFLFGFLFSYRVPKFSEENTKKC